MTGERWFLSKGNGHQVANRRKALEFVISNLRTFGLLTKGQ